MNVNKIKRTEYYYQVFMRDVIFKYDLFSGLFLGLPFKSVEMSGTTLFKFTKLCDEGLQAGQTPLQIVEGFFSLVGLDSASGHDLLFNFLQFIERQVVLFDALEDSAFSATHDSHGVGSIDYLLNQITADDNGKVELFEQILSYYKVRLVLTAHPTQFYPNQILGIIADLGQAFKQNDFTELRSLFLQLGLTRFSIKHKPTPLDEAVSLIWFLENIFYKELNKIQEKLPSSIANFELGFWPGGDRDGNPFVVAETTLQVAQKLRKTILRLYHEDLKQLKRKLTFDVVYDKINVVTHKIENDTYLDANELIDDLTQIIDLLNRDYQSLFVELVESMVQKVKLFDFYFVKLDIRQNSVIHTQVVANMLQVNQLCDNYSALTESQKIKLLKENTNNIHLWRTDYVDDMVNEVLNTIQAIYSIRQSNGKKAIERYIISNTSSVLSILEVCFLINLTNNYLSQTLKVAAADLISVEIVPLFETIDDLKQAESIMEALYNNAAYLKHLALHNNRQTIMLGFSDGTKDGGYLMANWSIYLAKKTLTALANKYAIDVVFFDGRGGSPSRGGGNIQDFYHSMSANVALNEIQLTIQGQTISTNFGTPEVAVYNLEQLFTSGLVAKLFPNKTESLSTEAEQLIALLANNCYDAYMELRQDNLFMPYLEEITPLKYLIESNIGSRPAKRGGQTQLRFEDLRAIPFVGAWTQMKQNILGYYGLGIGIKQLLDQDRKYLKKLNTLYRNSLFFKTLINNAMQSLYKSNFAISQYLEEDPKFGQFWCKLRDENKLAKEMLLKITGHRELLETDAITQESIGLREKIVLPLLVIQQYALMKLRGASADSTVLAQLVKKSLAANINAGRNSV